MNIVGISGQIGSGKDTVADCFVDNGYTKVSLADPMKRLAFNVFDFSEEQLWGPSECRNAVDHRYYKDSMDWRIARSTLQTIGPTWLEDLMPDTTAADRGAMFFSLKKWFEQLHTDHPNLSPRICLQTLGTEWGREACHMLVWVEYMQRTAGSLLRPGTYSEYTRTAGLTKCTDGPFSERRYGVVVPDVRFKNELEFFSYNNMNVVRVERPDTDAAASGIGVSKHKSEMEQQGFDPKTFSAIIENTGTLDQLLGTAATLAEQFRTQEQS